jgi:hypothetical protein
MFWKRVGHYFERVGLFWWKKKKMCIKVKVCCRTFFCWGRALSRIQFSMFQPWGLTTSDVKLCYGSSTHMSASCNGVLWDVRNQMFACYIQEFSLLPGVGRQHNGILQFDSRVTKLLATRVLSSSSWRWTRIWAEESVNKRLDSNNSASSSKEEHEQEQVEAKLDQSVETELGASCRNGIHFISHYTLWCF